MKQRPSNAEPTLGQVRHRWVRAVVAGVCCLFAAVMVGGTTTAVTMARSTVSAAAQSTGAVYTRDGRVVEGNVTERRDEVVVDVRGIVTTLPREQVVRIEWGTSEERLARRLDALDEGDVAGRIELARDALGRRVFEVAQRAVDEVRHLEPGNAEAAELFTLIDRQRRLEHLRGNGVRQDREPRQRPRGGRALRPGEAQVLTDDQVNRIRQAELQEFDAQTRRPPRINFRDNVVRRYVDSQPNLDFRDFNRLHDVIKALEILEHGTPDMREDVVIVSDPSSILFYKNNVQAVVLENCATSECHGGSENAGFFLHRSPRDDKTSYANFYVLSTATVVRERMPGAFGEGELRQRLIDRESPDRSLLLHFMLPAARTENPHPEVEGFRPRFNTPDNTQFQTIRTWISDSLRRMPRDYGFQFDPLAPEPDPNGDEDEQP